MSDELDFERDPDDLFDFTEKFPIDDPFVPNDSHEYDPFTDPTIKKVGNTTYTVNIRCRGAESILGKIRRLLLNDPLSQMTLLPHDISRKV